MAGYFPPARLARLVPGVLLHDCSKGFGFHGGIFNMTEERTEIVHEDTAPRWIGIAVIVLAIISLAALGVGWTASNRSTALQQALATQTTQTAENNDVLGQRLAKAE